MENNASKRIVIILIYLTLFSLVGYFFYSFFKPKETCVDKIKNQNEEEVDCGGVCAPCKKIEAQPLRVQEAGLVPSGFSNQYDFYGLVANPNNVFGSNEFTYEIIFKDSSGNVLLKKTGTSYILPKENKYLVEYNVNLENSPALVELNILKTDWVEFNSYYERPELKVVNKTYNEISSGIGFAEVKGLLKNDSPFDFNQIKIRIILKDSNGKIVALNSTEMGTVKSNEERDFRAFWPSRFPGEVQNIETQVEVNVFDSQAFVKRYFQNQQL